MDKTLRLWDVATGKPVGEPFKGHTGTVFRSNFSPDGKRAVSSSEDGTLRLWDLETGKPIGEPIEGHTAAVISAAFSPDGKHIVSASQDKTVRLWEAATPYPSLKDEVVKADTLCPLDGTERTDHGLFNSRFPDKSKEEWTTAERRACGLPTSSLAEGGLQSKHRAEKRSVFRPFRSRGVALLSWA